MESLIDWRVFRIFLWSDPNALTNSDRISSDRTISDRIGFRFKKITNCHRRTRQGGRRQLPTHPNFGKPLKFGQMLRKIKKIRADLSENRLNSGNFITTSIKIRANFQLPPWKASARYSFANCRIVNLQSDPTHTSSPERESNPRSQMRKALILWRLCHQSPNRPFRKVHHFAYRSSFSWLRRLDLTNLTYTKTSLYTLYPKRHLFWEGLLFSARTDNFCMNILDSVSGSARRVLYTTPSFPLNVNIVRRFKLSFSWKHKLSWTKFLI